jgi:hypothetical protein
MSVVSEENRTGAARKLATSKRNHAAKVRRG